MGNLVSRYIPHYMKCDDCNYYVRLPQRENSVDHKKAINNYRIGIGKKSYYTIADFIELIIS